MTLAEIIAQASLTLDDTTTPRLWSDAELVNYCNQAINELCEKTYILVDTTSTFCTVTLATSTSKYALDSRIIVVENVLPSWTQVPLTPLSIQYMDNASTGWRTMTGAPRQYTTELDTGYLRVYPIPTSTYNGNTLSLTVRRYPLAQMTSSSMSGQTPEIPFQFHNDLVHGIAAWAYSKQDAETIDPAKRDYHKAMWQQAIDRVNRYMIHRHYVPLTANPSVAFT